MHMILRNHKISKDVNICIKCFLCEKNKLEKDHFYSISEVAPMVLC